MGMGLGGRGGTGREADPPAPAAQVSLCDVGPSLALSGPQCNHLYQRRKLGLRLSQDLAFSPQHGGQEGPLPPQSLHQGSAKGFHGQGVQGSGLLYTEAGHRVRGGQASTLSLPGARPSADLSLSPCPTPPATVFGRIISFMTAAISQSPLSQTSPILASTVHTS